MKVLFLTSLFLFAIASEKCLGQTTKYYPFIHYITTHLNPPKSVKENCEWQFALVKLEINRRNYITGYSMLNKASDELKNSFKFLKGYKFPQEISINGRPLVFCVSISNEKGSCGDQRLYTPSQTLGIVYSNMRPQLEAQPQTIFIFDIVDIVYSTDSIR